MAEGRDPEKNDLDVTVGSLDEDHSVHRTWRQKVAGVVWDSLDKSPEERKFISKLDWWVDTGSEAVMSRKLTACQLQVDSVLLLYCLFRQVSGPDQRVLRGSRSTGIC